jgi:SAM-dependent methyltransferase
MVDTADPEVGVERPWLSPEALRLPFDQYQRYSGAARAVSALKADGSYSMLEVGGAPGFPELFFRPQRLAVVDRFGTHAGNFIVVDGARLPFPDESFDVVVTLDTLEHVVAEDRPAFLQECRRVSRDLVILSAPHATAHVVEAEKALQSFVTARFGEVFETLQEHSDRGLPIADETRTALAAGEWSCVMIPSGYLPRWLVGMVVHHELLAVGLPELPDMHAFYNSLMAYFDNAEPAYRRLVIASRHSSSAQLQAVADQLTVQAPAGRADAVTSAVIGRLLSERVGFANAEMVRKAREHDVLATHLDERRAAVRRAEQALALAEVRVHELQRSLDLARQDNERLLAALDSHTVKGTLRAVVRRLRGRTT